MTDYIVSSGIVSGGIALNAGNVLTVLSGGFAQTITVNSGGSEVVSSGDVASGVSCCWFRGHAA